MSTLIRSALVALVLTGASAAAMAAPAKNAGLSDNSKPNSAYDLNSPEDARAFWDNQASRGN